MSNEQLQYLQKLKEILSWDVEPVTNS
jgi:hypothetical protein